MSAATLSDALAFIAGAEETDLDRLIDGVKMRRKTLANLRAAAVRVGMEIATDGLSPKYLNNLTGTIRGISGQRADVELDEPSTNTLRYSGKRFYVAPDVERYVLRGVPLQCCTPTPTDA